MYVTLEPCPMCAGAIVQARIPSVVIGCMNPKAGCAGSVLDMLHEEGFNHQAETRIGILGETCSAMLSDFFRNLRKKKAEQKAEQKARQLMDGDRPADTAGKQLYFRLLLSGTAGAQSETGRQSGRQQRERQKQCGDWPLRASAPEDKAW